MIKSNKANLVILLVFLVGCSSNDPASYAKTIDTVLTDQFIGSGIYWVSNDHIILTAAVKGKEQDGHWSIYQVDVRDSSYTKIIDISGTPPLSYKYCYDGEILYVMVKNADVNILDRPSWYEIKITKLDDFQESTLYSSLSCRFLEKPTLDARYSVLREGDGLIKYERGAENSTDVYLSDDLGNRKKKLVNHARQKRNDVSGRFKAETFLQSQNAYFGVSYPNNKNCFDLWWLYRDDWAVENKTLCLGKWAKDGSKLIHSLDDALLVERYTARSGMYLIHDGQLEQIEEGDTRGVSISPDGCKVAYGKGPMRLFIDKAGQRQKLKIFDFCEFKNNYDPYFLGVPLKSENNAASEKRTKRYGDGPLFELL